MSNECVSTGLAYVSLVIVLIWALASLFEMVHNLVVILWVMK